MPSMMSGNVGAALAGDANRQDRGAPVDAGAALPLPVLAATMPAMMVPCQELFSTAQPENSGLARSALLT